MPATVHTLTKLKELRRERGSDSPFSNHIEFLAWADKAEPLLAFNTQLAEDFAGIVRAATSVQTWRPENYLGAVNNAIGTVNKAITLLETQVAATLELTAPEAEPSALTLPEKLTLKWLYEHAPWSFYVWLICALSAAFAVGFTASEIRTAIYNNTLSVATPATTNPTAAKQATTNMNPSSNVKSFPK